MFSNNPKKSLLIACGAILLIVATFYIYKQTNEFFKGPTIDLSAMKKGPYNESLITISGRAVNVAFLTLNGHPIYTDESSKFKEKLMLLPGYNIIEIEARDKFGRQESKTVELVYVPPSGI